MSNTDKLKLRDSDYQRLYGFAYGTIRSWRRDGAPLDDPVALLNWILSKDNSSARRGSRVDLSKLQALASKKPKKPKALPIPPTRPAISGPQEPPPRAQEPPGASQGSQEVPTPPETADQALQGLFKQLARLAEEIDSTWAAYQRALGLEDPLAAEAHWKTWDSMLKTYASVAKSAPKSEQEAGKVVSIPAVSKVWSESLQVLRATLNRVGRRCASHQTFRHLDPISVEEVIGAEIAEAVGELFECRWLTSSGPLDGQQDQGTEGGVGGVPAGVQAQDPA